jgi:hypothetical protein
VIGDCRFEIERIKSSGQRIIGTSGQRAIGTSGDRDIGPSGDRPGELTGHGVHDNFGLFPFAASVAKMGYLSRPL